MISSLTKADLYLKFFGLTKIPLLWFCRPKIMHLNERSVEIKIPLKRRTKNHLGSMYFGALSVGADITGGFLAMICIQNSKRKVALIFKDFKADFLKRAEGDVHFRCNQGSDIIRLVEKTIDSGQRENMIVNIDAYVPSISDDIVANFELTLSLKKK
tara:strand:- start:822 stop:1292 length:471 start_codon:yes stop_codon:yes gene_type:complete